MWLQVYYFMFYILDKIFSPWLWWRSIDVLICNTGEIGAGTKSTSASAWYSKGVTGRVLPPKHFWCMKREGMQNVYVSKELTDKTKFVYKCI